jgi:membrane-associated phospholipid phosphatase
MVGAASGRMFAGLGLAALNLAVAVLSLALMPRMRAGRGAARFLGVTLPLFVFYLFFKEAGLALSRPGIVWLDSIVARPEIGWWTAAGTDPGSALLGELLAAAYMSYIPLLVTVAVVLVALPERGSRAPAETFVRRVCIAWAICYVLYLIIPVLGPRFVYVGYQPPRMGPGPISALAQYNQDHGMLRGAAFPSAHVAATAVAVWSAWRWRRAVFPFVFPMSVALVIGAVYLGYHYVVDVLAGLLVAALATSTDHLAFGAEQMIDGKP